MEIIWPTAFAEAGLLTAEDHIQTVLSISKKIPHSLFTICSNSLVTHTIEISWHPEGIFCISFCAHCLLSYQWAPWEELHLLVPSLQVSICTDEISLSLISSKPPSQSRCSLPFIISGSFTRFSPVALSSPGKHYLFYFTVEYKVSATTSYLSKLKFSISA